MEEISNINREIEVKPPLSRRLVSCQRATSSGGKSELKRDILAESGREWETKQEERNLT